MASPIVADAMVTQPAVHPPSTTVAQLRAFFADEHVHMALLVEEDRLVGTVERTDIAPPLPGSTPASKIARLDGRTVGPDTLLRDAVGAMTRDARRRLAVVDGESMLVGLLCLKASGLGFCSDADVAGRSPREVVVASSAIPARRREPSAAAGGRKSMS
jgi:predicted transcriptional regulator